MVLIQANTMMMLQVQMPTFGNESNMCQCAAAHTGQSGSDQGPFDAPSNSATYGWLSQQRRHLSRKFSVCCESDKRTSIIPE